MELWFAEAMIFEPEQELALGFGKGKENSKFTVLGFEKGKDNEKKL